MKEQGGGVSSTKDGSKREEGGPSKDDATGRSKKKMDEPSTKPRLFDRSEFQGRTRTFGA